MPPFRRFQRLPCPLITLLALLGACSDHDETDVCLGPGCPTYQGAGGYNTLTAGSTGGASGITDGGPSDAGAEGGASSSGDASTIAPEPCQLAFVLPFALDGRAISLAESDDVDGEACGPSFVAHVVLQSNASTVDLFVNDNPLGAVSVSDGIVRFEAALGNRGELGNALRAEASMADGQRCSAELGGGVFVDCPGPSCSIDEPLANGDGFLNQGDDGNAEFGLQTDIAVISEAENAGNDVRLEIDDDFEAVPSASIVAEDGDGRASFPRVTLEEGVHTIRAECSDGFGGVTLSPAVEWNVDVSACSLELDSVANGADPITPDDDLDGQARNGFDVLVSGSVEGDDCERIQIGECGDDLVDIDLSGLLDDDGQFLVPIRLEARTARVSLCARVSDTAGNESSPDVELEVAVRADAPVTSPPPAIGAPSFVVSGRREGTLELSWNSVLDASSDPLVAYHLRCARADILTEADWEAASVFPVTVTPASAAGISETQGITNFRAGLERFCMVRGQDASGQISPLEGDAPTVARVSNPFLTLAYSSITPTTVSGIRVSLAALGDVNGDGEDDFAYGTQNGGVEVFFGGPDLSPTPDVTIAGPPAQSPAHEFGANVAGLGDVNGDGRPDFAVSARILSHGHAPLGGSVYVFFGRAGSAAWDALAPINLAVSPGCGADLCFHSSDGAAALGSAITSTDFDGDGETDLVIGAQNRTSDNAVQRVGRVYVVLGGSQLAAGGVFELGGTALNGFIINPPTTGTRSFGVNVAAVGFGSDARGDLVVSSLGRNVGGENINAEVFSVPGRQHPGFEGLATIAAGQAFAIGAPSNFGNPMRATGDVNGDGFGDVWVSTNFELNGVSPVYLGRSTGFSGVSLFGYTNDVIDNEWGVYVATGFHTELGRLGDLDNNGFDDVLIGSAFANNEPGSADLFYSDGTTQNRRRSAADVTFHSAGNGQMTPSFVGDIDGDGFRDIAILDSGSALPATTLTLYY